MATYLCVKVNSTSVKSYEAKSSAAKPYLCVSGGYFPLTTETGTGLKVKANGSTYRLAEGGQSVTTTTTATHTVESTWTRSGSETQRASSITFYDDCLSISTLTSVRRNTTTAAMSFTHDYTKPYLIRIHNGTENLFTGLVTYPAYAKSRTLTYISSAVKTGTIKFTNTTYSSFMSLTTNNIFDINSTVFNITDYFIGYFTSTIYDVTEHGYDAKTVSTTSTIAAGTATNSYTWYKIYDKVSIDIITANFATSRHQGYIDANSSYNISGSTGTIGYGKAVKTSSTVSGCTIVYTQRNEYTYSGQTTEQYTTTTEA